MKHIKLTTLLFLLISCHNGNNVPQTEYPKKETESKIAKTDLPGQVYSYNELNNKAKLFSIADSILKIKNHPNIINLHAIYSSNINIIEDYFIHPDKKSMMVFFGCDAGFSSGNSNKLLLIFDCKNGKGKLIWSGQHALFSKKDIKDLNGDSIMEIVNISNVAWMSSEKELFEIINFRNGKRNTLYSTLSNTQRDYFDEDWYNIGDTISCVYQNKLLQNSKHGIIRIQQNKTVKLFNGGKTPKTAFKKSKIKANSTIITIQ